MNENAKIVFRTSSSKVDRFSSNQDQNDRRWLLWSSLDVNLSTFDNDMCGKRFCIFCNDFRCQWPWLLTFRPHIYSPVTLVRRYVSTKLEVSTAFLFRENRRQSTNEQKKYKYVNRGLFVTFLMIVDTGGTRGKKNFRGTNWNYLFRPRRSVSLKCVYSHRIRYDRRV